MMKAIKMMILAFSICLCLFGVSNAQRDRNDRPNANDLRAARQEFMEKASRNLEARQNLERAKQREKEAYNDASRISPQDSINAERAYNRATKESVERQKAEREVRETRKEVYDSGRNLDRVQREYRAREYYRDRN